MCRCAKSYSTSVCILYFCISYSAIGLLLLIHLNHNTKSASALIFVPPLPFFLLLLVSHNKIEPEGDEDLIDLRVITVDPKLPDDKKENKDPTGMIKSPNISIIEEYF